MNHFRAAISLIALATSGCQQPGSTTPQVADALEQGLQGLEWVEAPENSRFYKAEDGSWAVRCWAKGKSYDCLQVTNMTPQSVVDADRSYGMLRANLSKLPDNLFNFGDDGAYHCEYRQESMKEAITRGEDTLTENLILLHSALEYAVPWSQEYVEQYAKENNMSLERSYFPCGTVGSALMNGSLATLGTTSISLLEFG